MRNGTHVTQTQRIMETLRDAIYDGRLAPGSPIRQERIAREHGVSRIPVREALRQLEAQGLVILQPNMGARVAMLDFRECIEIYRIRERLEPLAFSESVGRLTPEQFDVVRARAQELEGMTADPSEWLTGDREFHLACYAGVPARLVDLIVGLWNTTQQYRRILLTTFEPRDFDVAHAEHKLMVEALTKGNPRGGEEIMRVAMERSRLRLTRNRHLFDR